jgi:succinate dehydrogenase / fumarate reductase membrane anchor subunit
VNLRSPLASVLGSGSAKEGTDHWWSQRLSAVALLLLGSWFLLSLARLDGFAHANVFAWAASPFNSVMLLLFVATLAWHSALGIQVVIEDYVHGAFIKLVSLILNKFAHVVLAIAGAFAVLKIALGGGT